MRSHGRRYISRSGSEVLELLAARRARGVRLTSMESVYLDGRGLCWRCGQFVEWGLADTDPMRASRDHVVPRRDGGPGLRHNLRLAHQRCNQERERVRGAQEKAPCSC